MPPSDRTYTSPDDQLAELLERHQQPDIGLAVRFLRAVHDITGSQLARKARINAGTVSKWETGKVFPERTTLMKVLEALEWSPHSFGIVLEGMEVIRRRTQDVQAETTAASSVSSARLSPASADDLWAEAQQLSGEVGSALDNVCRFVLRLALWTKLNGPGGAGSASPPSAMDR